MPPERDFLRKDRPATLRQEILFYQTVAGDEKEVGDT